MNVSLLPLNIDGINHFFYKMYRSTHARTASQHTITTIDDRDSSWKGQSLRKIKQFANDVMAQRLHGRYSMPTAVTVLPLGVVSGILCIVMGLLILHSNRSVYAVEFKYKLSDGPTVEKCFTLPQDLDGPFIINYRLRNVYFNHRKMSSENRGYCEDQLQGKSFKEYNESCLYIIEFGINFGPSTMLKEMIFDPVTNLPYAPIGPLANAMFNDTYELKYLDKDMWVDVPLTNSSIVSPREKSFYADGDCSAPHFINTTKPPNFARPLCEIDGYQNVDFIVWMRTTAHNTFKKTYRYVNHTGIFTDKLPKGQYRIIIKNNYNVEVLCPTGVCPNGAPEKSVLIFRPSWYGNDDVYFHLICLCAGIILLGTTACLTMLHVMYGNTLEKMSHITEEDEDHKDEEKKIA